MTTRQTKAQRQKATSENVERTRLHLAISLAATLEELEKMPEAQRAAVLKGIAELVASSTP
jgi:hypothetical protein